MVSHVFKCHISCFPGGAVEKNALPVQEMQEMWVWSLGQEGSLE